MKILTFNKPVFNKSYLAVSVLGTSLKLNIKYVSSSNAIELNKKNTEIDILLPRKFKNSNNEEIVNLAINKMYKEIAITEIEYAMEISRHILEFAPEDYKIETLQDTFYKISKGKIITINPQIVQYSREVINTTIIQAFCKMKFKANSENYKKTLRNALIKYDEYKESSKLRIIKVG